MRISRVFVGGFLFVALLVVGFILLLRSCLARYDERTALAPVLYFEKEGKATLFSLVQYDKTNNYSSRGGITSKSVSSSYFIQQNDPVSGVRTAEEKIKHHSDIKYHPVETMGASKELAWVFIGELMAFDPFTLEKKADIALLENKNPALKGQFPGERRFYLFNDDDQQVYFTANDGSKWQLNTTTLLATPTHYDPEKEPQAAAVQQVEKLQQQNRAAQDSLYKNEYPATLYAKRQITEQEYRRRMTSYVSQQKDLYKQRDSLNDVLSALRSRASHEQQRQSAIRNLQRPKPSYAQIKTNQDTMAGKWYGLYAVEEWDKLYNRVQYQSSYDETARGQLYLSTYTPSRNGDLLIEKEQATLLSPASYFLHGGFLLDKTTAMPIRLAAPRGYLVVYKDKIGREGKIVLSRLNEQGKPGWTFATGLTEWIDWRYTGKQLFILGADNPELSGTEANVLFCIDLTTGKANRYDYFTDRKR